MFAAIDRMAVNAVAAAAAGGRAVAAAEQGSEFSQAFAKFQRQGMPGVDPLTPREEFVVLPIKWNYEAPPDPVPDGAGVMDQVMRAPAAAVAAMARRNPFQYYNVAELPEARPGDIYLVFTEIHGTRSCGLTVSKEKAIAIANWAIKLWTHGAEPLVNDIRHPLAQAQGGGGKRRKRRKTHKRKTQTHRRKTHRRKRTRRGR